VLSLWQAGADDSSSLPTVIDEFGAGYSDDCGPNANAILVAMLRGERPSYAQMDAIRSRDLQAGRFVSGGGQGVADIAWDVRRFAPDLSVEVSPYIQGGYSQQLLRSRMTDLVQLSRQGNTVGSVVNIDHGGLLPYNQPGVGGHYVAVLGYDPASDQVLVGNGDKRRDLRWQTAPDWMPLSSLAGAQVKGLVNVWRSGSPDGATWGTLEASTSVAATWLSGSRVAKLAVGVVLIGAAAYLVFTGERAAVVGAVARSVTGG
jgi:hypothetical protein